MQLDRSVHVPIVALYLLQLGHSQLRGHHVPLRQPPAAPGAHLLQPLSDVIRYPGQHPLQEREYRGQRHRARLLPALLPDAGGGVPGVRPAGVADAAGAAAEPLRPGSLHVLRSAVRGAGDRLALVQHTPVSVQHGQIQPPHVLAVPAAGLGGLFLAGLLPAGSATWYARGQEALVLPAGPALLAGDPAGRGAVEAPQRTEIRPPGGRDRPNVGRGEHLGGAGGGRGT